MTLKECIKGVLLLEAIQFICYFVQYGFNEVKTLQSLIEGIAFVFVFDSLLLLFYFSVSVLIGVPLFYLVCGVLYLFSMIADKIKERKIKPW